MKSPDGQEPDGDGDPAVPAKRATTSPSASCPPRRPRAAGSDWKPSSASSAARSRHLPPQAAPALHLARRPRAPSGDPRRGRGRARPRHPVLDHAASSPRRRATRRFVSWHQDATYWGLSEPDVVTAWVALHRARRRTAACAIVPGHATGDQLPHVDTFAPDNLLSRGQEIAVEVDERAAVDIVLRAGRDVAPPRAARARLAAQPLRRSAHRLRDPLHADPRAPARRTSATAPRSCAASTPSATSSSSRGPRPICSRDCSRCTPRSATARRGSSTRARTARSSDNGR